MYCQKYKKNRIFHIMNVLLFFTRHMVCHTINILHFVTVLLTSCELRSSENLDLKVIDMYQRTSCFFLRRYVIDLQKTLPTEPNEAA